MASRTLRLRAKSAFLSATMAASVLVPLSAPAPALAAEASNGSISGFVTDADDTPLVNVCVSAFDLDGVRRGDDQTLGDTAGRPGFEEVRTNDRGFFFIYGLTQGSYKLRFWDCGNQYDGFGLGDVDFAREYSGDAVSFQAATSVAISASDAQDSDTFPQPSGDKTVNAVLGPDAVFNGTVQDDVDNSFLGAVCVQLYDAGPSGALVAETATIQSTDTTIQGKYNFRGLREGSYHVMYRDDLAECGSLDRFAGTDVDENRDRDERLADGNNTHASEWYDNVAGIADATLVELPEDGSTAGPINASLARVSQAQGIRGTVRDDAGAAVGGICVTAFATDAPSGMGVTTETNLSGGYQLALTPGKSYLVEVHERCVPGSAPGPSDDLYVAEFSTGLAYDDDDAPPTATPKLSDFADRPADAAATAVTTNAFATVNATIAKRGSIAGIVTDEGSSPTGLDGVCVLALGGVGARNLPAVPHRVTANGGAYTIGNLRPGSYVLHFLPEDAADDPASATDEHCDGTQSRNTFLPEYYNGATARSSATPVTVASGQAVTGRNASLRDKTNTKKISGRVTNSANAGLAGVCVNVLDFDGVRQASTQTEADAAGTPSVNEAGNYSVPVAPGQYKVEFARPDTCSTTATAPGDDLYVATEYYNDSPTFAGGQTVTVATQDVAGINAQVARGARIEGAVDEFVNSTTTKALTEDICVELTSTSGTVIRDQETKAGFAFEGVAPGQYFVRFDDRDPQGTCGGDAFADSTDNFRTEWWNNKRSQADATPITLAAGDDRQGVNASMDRIVGSTSQFTMVTGYVENGDDDGIDGVIVEFFRFDQDPGVDAPVMTTTTGIREMVVARRGCFVDFGEPCTEDIAEPFDVDISVSGYWEISAQNPAKDGAGKVMTTRPTGSYKVRFRDPTGLHATEWFRGNASFDAAQSVVLTNQSTVEVGERREDRDVWDLDKTDDNEDPQLCCSADPGDELDYDFHAACRWDPNTGDRVGGDTGCPWDGPFANEGHEEFITDLGLAGTIDGRVTVEQTGSPAADVRVDVLGEATGAIVASGFTKSDGTYRILGVAPGGYKVQFIPADANLAGEFFNDQATFGAADVIAVGASTTRSAVNGTLKQNTAPKPADDRRQVEVNKSATYNDLMANDVDPEADPITIKSVGTASHGTVVLNENGSVTYTPAKDNQDDATFTYTVADTRGLTGTATVTVDVVGQIVGVPPSANDDEASTPINTSIAIPVLANDTDPDGDTSKLALTSVGVPFHGTATIQGRSIFYTPTTGFSGLDQFSYDVTDTQGFTSSAKVTVAVNASGKDSASKSVAAGGTVATEGSTANADNPIITTVTSPNAGTVTIKEEKVAAGQVSDITTLTWRSVITAPNATASNPLTFTFRLDGSLIQGVEQPARALRVLRDNALVGDCLGSTTANPDPCISGHRMIGDDVFVTIKTSKASTWTFGFDNDAVVDRASGAAGTGRVGTAVAVSRNAYSPGDVDTVVIARKDAYPDALAGAPLAHQLGAPMLLTTKDSLDAITRAEIVRLGATRVVILGGTAAVSSGVETSLRNIPGVTVVDRLRGADRYATAAVIAQQLTGYDTAYVVEGADADPARGWPDAVAVAGLAAFEGRPILLVTTEQLPAATRNALSGLSSAVIVGGTASVSTSVQNAVDQVVGSVARVRGTDRYETSFAVAQRAVAAGMSASSVWVATGRNFPDALAAGPAVAREGGILLLVHGTNYDASPAVDRFLKANRTKVETLTIVGGTAVISVGSEVRMAQATTN